MYDFVYLLMGLQMIPLLVLLFMLNKKYINKKLLTNIFWISLLWSVLWSFSEIFYLYDYWKPESIFSFQIYGHYYFLIEDIIFWFLFTACLYLLFNNINSKQGIFSWKIFSKYLILAFLIMFWLFLFWINSFIATILSTIIISIYLWFDQKKYINVKKMMIFSSIFSIYMFLNYMILWILFPWWVETFYFFKNTQEIIVFGYMPIDDFFWYPFAWMAMYFIFVKSIKTNS